jgi:transposase
MATTASAGANGLTGGMNDDHRDVEVPVRAKGQRYSARYKLEILAEYEQLGKEGKGALLRREKLSTLIGVAQVSRPRRARGAVGTVGPATGGAHRSRDRTARDREGQTGQGVGPLPRGG